MNSTILIALSSTLTASAGVIGIFFSGNPYVKDLSASVVVVSTLLTILQAIISQRGAEFTRRALSNLIRSVQPNDLVREAIFAAAHEEARAIGLPISHVVGFESSKFLIEFFDNERKARGGLLCLTPQDISEFALHDAKTMKREMRKLIRHKYERKALEESWNDVAREIGLTAELVFAFHLQKPSTVKLWANVAEKYIAVGPPNCPDDTPPSNRAEFPELALLGLLSMNTLKRGATIAEKVEGLLAMAHPAKG